MRRLAAGLVQATTVSAAALGTVVAPSDTVTEPVVVSYTAGEGGWTLDSDSMDDVELVQSPERTQLEWMVPDAVFKNTQTGQELDGTLFIRPTGGSEYQPDWQFVDGDTGAIYAYGSQAGSGYGVPTYYYSPDGYGNPPGSAGEFLTGGDGTHVGTGLSWLLQPANYSDPTSYSEALNSVPFSDVMSLGPGGSGQWSADHGADHAVLYQDTPIWSSPASFINGETTIDGTVYMQSLPAMLGLYNEEFVTGGGALYDYNQRWFGFDNLYYDPGNGGAVVDILRTPFGDLNLSPVSWLITPPDYSDVSTPSEATTVLTDMLQDSSLPATIDFGRSVAGAGPTGADAAASTADVATPSQVGQIIPSDADAILMGPTGQSTVPGSLMNYYTQSYLQTAPEGGFHSPDFSPFTGDSGDTLSLTYPALFTQASYLHGDAIVVDALLQHYSELMATGQDDPLYLFGYSQSSTILTAVDSHLNDAGWLNFVLTHGGYGGDTTAYAGEIDNLAAIAPDLRLVLLGDPAADPGGDVPAGWDNNPLTQSILNSESMGYGGGTIDDVNTPTGTAAVVGQVATVSTPGADGQWGTDDDMLTNGYGMAGQNTNADLSPTVVYTVADDNWAQVQQGWFGPSTVSIAHAMYPGMNASMFDFVDHVGNVDYYEATPNIFEDFSIWGLAAWNYFWAMFG